MRCLLRAGGYAPSGLSLFRHYRISAALSCFFHAEFGAIDQVGDNVFAVVFLPGRGFHDSGAQGDLRGIPWRPHARRGAPQFFHQVMCARQRRVGKYERQRPGCVFHRHIVLPHHRLQRPRQLLQEFLQRRFSLLPQHLRASIDL